jgi:ribosomal protein S9
MSDIRYPRVNVQLSGQDGNAFAVMGAVSRALLDNGVSRKEVEKYKEESMSGDYDHLLQTAMRWVNVS